MADTETVLEKDAAIDLGGGRGLVSLVRWESGKMYLLPACGIDNTRGGELPPQPDEDVPLLLRLGGRRKLRNGVLPQADAAARRP